jgi:hypothetical protein
MKTFHAILLFALAIFCQTDAMACSCGPRGSVESALRDATVVVVADVVSIEQYSATGQPNSRYIIEEATFKIVETLKGALRPGDLLPIRSNLGPAGPCGVSAKNSPVWLETVKNGKSMAIPLSGRWVIYGQGKAPFELDPCSHSTPIEAGGEYELRRLRELTLHAKKTDGGSQKADE